jgi:hypothetical protein
MLALTPKLSTAILTSLAGLSTHGSFAEICSSYLGSKYSVLVVWRQGHVVPDDDAIMGSTLIAEQAAYIRQWGPEHRNASTGEERLNRRVMQNLFSYIGDNDCSTTLMSRESRGLYRAKRHKMPTRGMVLVKTRSWTQYLILHKKIES